MVARNLGVKNLREFAARYALVVGDYGSDAEDSIDGARYFPKENVVLVDKQSWIKKNDNEKENRFFYHFKVISLKII